MLNFTPLGFERGVGLMFIISASSLNFPPPGFETLCRFVHRRLAKLVKFYSFGGLKRERGTCLARGEVSVKFYSFGA